jgi:peptidoglycan/LPS O-acetylase OafA/YrhL
MWGVTFSMIAFVVVFLAIWIAIRWKELSERQRRQLVIPGSLVVLGLILGAYAGYHLNPYGRTPPLEIYYVLIAGIGLIFLGARMIRSLLMRARWLEKRNEPS